MATPEQKLEDLMVAAELAEAVRDKLLSPEDRERLEAVGYEVTTDVWGDPVARPPYDLEYRPAALHVALLDVMGEETASAAEALCRMGNAQGARDLRDASRAEALRRIRR